MRPAIYTTVGTTGRAWALQLLTEAGAAVNLTGATSATFSMAPRDGGAVKVDGAAALVADGTYTLADGSSQAFTPTDGVLIYQPAAGDVDTAGVFNAQFSYQVAAKPVIDPGYGYLEIHLQPAI